MLTDSGGNVGTFEVAGKCAAFMDLPVKRNTIGETREPAETRWATGNARGTVKM